MKEPKITITGRFTSTGEEWCETAKYVIEQMGHAFVRESVTNI